MEGLENTKWCSASCASRRLSPGCLTEGGGENTKDLTGEDNQKTKDTLVLTSTGQTMVPIRVSYYGTVDKGSE